MVRLLREVAPGVDASGMGFGALRDELLRAAPLDLEHVKRVNAAEAAFWRRNEGWRCDWSDNILGFDCGGQQHVYEVAFRTGDDVERNSGRDLAFMRELLDMIEREGDPRARADRAAVERREREPSEPGEQRRRKRAGLHSWVGIIMYLPSDDAEERDAITRAFERYAEMEESALGEKYGTRTHWAKIELPDAPADREAARAKLARRYPGIPERFRDARKTLDPKGTLGNDMIEALLGNPESARGGARWGTRSSRPRCARSSASPTRFRRRRRNSSSGSTTPTRRGGGGSSRRACGKKPPPSPSSGRCSRRARR